MGAEQSHDTQEAVPQRGAEAPREPISESYDTQTTLKSSKSSKNLPHDFEAILKDADCVIEQSSMDKLLYDGVFLNQKRKKYWVDRNSNNNCFLLFARDLSITWAEDGRYWQWTSFRETSEDLVDVPELLNVCWLEIHGKFDTAKLTPGIKYEVVFVVMLKDPAYGWETPVNIRLTLPDGRKQEHKENMMDKLRGRWIEIPVGEFMVEAKKGGCIEFSLYEYENGAWKRGLLVKGVAIRPKN